MNIAIIPARYGSKRLLAKPLLKINNKPLVQLTYEAVLSSRLFDNVFIATDSKKIYQVASEFGGQCIMTSEDCENGTERCAETIKKLNEKVTMNDLIINIQCDEPFIQKQHLKKIVDLFKYDNGKIGTLIGPIKSLEKIEESVVKVGVDDDNFAETRV